MADLKKGSAVVLDGKIADVQVDSLGQEVVHVELSNGDLFAVSGENVTPAPKPKAPAKPKADK